MGVLTELFGVESGLEVLWAKLPAATTLDLENSLSDLLDTIREPLTSQPILGLRVCRGDGARYALFAAALCDSIVPSGAGVVLFNPSLRISPVCSVAPMVAKRTASLRIRVLGGIAMVVKSRWGETSAWCSIEP